MGKSKVLHVFRKMWTFELSGANLESQIKAKYIKLGRVLDLHLR